MSIEHNPTRHGVGVASLSGFYFAARPVIALFLIRIAGVEPPVAAATTLVCTFLLLGLVALSVLGVARDQPSPVFDLVEIRWVLLFLAFSGCSLLWGESASPMASAAYWCGTASDVAVVLVLLRNYLVPDVGWSLMKGFLWGSCLVAALAWLMPAQSDFRLGDEDYLNANTIANLCGFSVFFAHYLIRTTKGRWEPVIFFLSVTLVRSLSKTAIVAFLISEAYLIIEDRLMTRRTRVFVFLLATAVVLMFWSLFEAYYDLYTTYGNQSETLTGRTAIWIYVVEAIGRRPWIGHGLDSMWKVVPPFGNFEARHAENEILEQLYSYGLAGLFLLVGLYLSLYRKLRKHSAEPQNKILLALLLFVVIRGLAEADAFDLLFPLWGIVLVTSLTCCTMTRSASNVIPLSFVEY